MPALSDDELADPQVLVSAAAEFRAMRRARNRFLPSVLVGEPAWDMLLELFCKYPGDLTVSSLSDDSGVHPATGLRWIAALEAQGLVQRTRNSDDHHQLRVTLSASGREVVRNCVAAMLRSATL